MSDYYAHTGLSTPEKDWQPLRKHLEKVALLARRWLEEARPGDAALLQAAYAAGLLHDQGKYRAEFQQYLHDDLSLPPVPRAYDAGEQE